MPDILDAHTFLAITGSVPLVDVRSPGEFRQGHIPGAINIPLFTDSERAEIGSLYVQAGHDQAVMKGLDIILPKTGKILNDLRRYKTGKHLRMYCWRGGMRSLNMAWMFETNGYHVSLLHGGYKAYRNWIRLRLADPARIVILGGYTGSGKTEILAILERTGEQVIDLERLASHKGSAFGGIGLPGQPTNEQFENDLYEQWHRLNKSKIIWLEDESRMIGRVTLPEPVIRKIQESPLVILDVPKEFRIERLVKEYAGIDDQLLCDAVMRIETRLGMQRVKEALTSIHEKDYAAVATQMLTYYDKSYLFSIQRRENQRRYHFPVVKYDTAGIASALLEFAYKTVYHESDLPGL